MRATKGYTSPRAPVRLPELPLFLREHLRLGDVHVVTMEGCHGDYERENRFSDTKCYTSVYGLREKFPNFIFRTRQGVSDVVSCVAECLDGSANEQPGDMAMGKSVLFCCFPL